MLTIVYIRNELASAMWDVLIQFIGWLAIAFLGGNLAIFVGLVVHVVWTDSIRPRLILLRKIEEQAEQIIASYADPELEAFARQERAWYRSEGTEQIYWYRVRKAVRGRLRSAR